MEIRYLIDHKWMTSWHSIDISIKNFLLGVRRENMEGKVAEAKEAFQINLSVVFDCICDMDFNILHDLWGAEHGSIFYKR